MAPPIKAPPINPPTTPAAILPFSARTGTESEDAVNTIKIAHTKRLTIGIPYVEPYKDMPVHRRVRVDAKVANPPHSLARTAALFSRSALIDRRSNYHCRLRVRKLGPCFRSAEHQNASLYLEGFWTDEGKIASVGLSIVCVINAA
jgi:hypothetical protein